MGSRMGRLVAAAAVAVAMPACTSSGGAKGSDEKSGAGWFQARPLIMPGQHATTARADPFGSLQVPTSEDAYRKLSRTQRADLANAVHGVSCAHPPHLSETAGRVACDTGADVFLLGAALFTGNDVVRATPMAPSADVEGWRVSLSLTSAAAERMYRWTSGHHVTAQSGAFNDVQTSSTPPCGPTMTTRCSDFTAYISDGVVVSIPVSFAAFGNTVVISGDFSEAFAAELVRKLAG